MAASTPTTSRRSALRFTFATLTAGLAMPMRSHAATALEHPSKRASGEDAKLIAACAEATRCKAWRCRINDTGGVSDEEAASADTRLIQAHLEHKNIQHTVRYTVLSAKRLATVRVR